MIRTYLNDEQWARIGPKLPDQKGDRGRNGDNNRLFVEAVLWIARVGAPWRDLPPEFGKWYSVYTRFWRWSKKGVWKSLFNELAEDPDFEYVMIDGTIVRVHQHGTGARGGTLNQAIGRSRGGLTTKIAALVDALGNLVRFVLLPGQCHDIKSVDALLNGIRCEAFLGDKAFDSKALRSRLAEDGIEAVIPKRKGTLGTYEFDRHKYKWRHLVENFFCQIKEFRRIATRYEKTAICFAAMIDLVSAVLWTR